MEGEIIKIKLLNNDKVKLEKINDLLKLSFMKLNSKILLIKDKKDFVSVIDKFKDIMYLCFNEINLIEETFNLNSLTYVNLNMINILLNTLEFLSNFILKYNFTIKIKKENNFQKLDSKNIKIINEKKHSKIKDEIERDDYKKLAEELLIKMEKGEAELNEINEPMILIEFNKIINEKLSNNFNKNINNLNNFLKNYGIEKTSNNLKKNLNKLSIKMNEEVKDCKQFENNNQKIINEHYEILKNLNNNFDYNEMKNELLDTFYKKQKNLSKTIIDYAQKNKNNKNKNNKNIMTNDTIKSIDIEINKKLLNLQDFLKNKYLDEIDELKIKNMNLEEDIKELKSESKKIENKNKFNEEILNGKLIEINKLYTENNKLKQSLDELKKTKDYLNNKNAKLDGNSKYITSLKKIIHEILKRYIEIDSINNKFKDSIKYFINDKQNQGENENIQLYLETLNEQFEEDYEKNKEYKKIIKNNLKEVDLLSKNGDESFIKTFEKNDSNSKNDDFLENLKNTIAKKQIRKMQSLNKDDWTGLNKFEPNKTMHKISYIGSNKRIINDEKKINEINSKFENKSINIINENLENNEKLKKSKFKNNNKLESKENISFEKNKIQEYIESNEKISESNSNINIEIKKIDNNYNDNVNNNKMKKNNKISLKNIKKNINSKSVDSNKNILKIKNKSIVNNKRKSVFYHTSNNKDTLNSNNIKNNNEKENKKLLENNNEKENKKLLENNNEKENKNLSENKVKNFKEINKNNANKKVKDHNKKKILENKQKKIFLNKIKNNINDSLKNFKKNELVEINDFIKNMFIKKNNNNNFINNWSENKINNILNEVKINNDNNNDENLYKAINSFSNILKTKDSNNLIIPFEFFIDINNSGADTNLLLDYKKNGIINKLVPIINNYFNKTKTNRISYDNSKVEDLFNFKNKTQNIGKKSKHKDNHENYNNNYNDNFTHDKIFENSLNLKEKINWTINKKIKNDIIQKTYKSNYTNYLFNNNNFNKIASNSNFKQSHCNLNDKKNKIQNLKNIKIKKNIKISKINSNSKRVSNNNNMIFSEKKNTSKINHAKLDKKNKILNLNSDINELFFIKN